MISLVRLAWHTESPSSSSTSRVCPPSWRNFRIRFRASAVAGAYPPQQASSSKPSVMGCSMASTEALVHLITEGGNEAI